MPNVSRRIWTKPVAPIVCRARPEFRRFASMSSKSLAGAALAAVFALSGCASLNVQDREAMLAAAQFTRKQADTPAKLAQIKAMPQHVFLYKQRKGARYYVYADADGCGCLYVGNETAYQQYQQIRLQKNIADEQLAAAEMQQEAAMDWGMWGPWGPGFY